MFLDTTRCWTGGDDRHPYQRRWVRGAVLTSVVPPEARPFIEFARKSSASGGDTQKRLGRYARIMEKAARREYLSSDIGNRIATMARSPDVAQSLAQALEQLQGRWGRRNADVHVALDDVAVSLR